ncbi:hypothetical protein ACJBU6_08005 [Exserohilum turcicum]
MSPAPYSPPPPSPPPLYSRHAIGHATLSGGPRFTVCRSAAGIGCSTCFDQSRSQEKSALPPRMLRPSTHTHTHIRIFRSLSLSLPLSPTAAQTAPMAGRAKAYANTVQQNTSSGEPGRRHVGLAAPPCQRNDQGNSKQPGHNCRTTRMRHGGDGRS